LVVGAGRLRQGCGAQGFSRLICRGRFFVAAAGMPVCAAGSACREIALRSPSFACASTMS
jgi:hypothetical protein